MIICKECENSDSVWRVGYVRLNETDHVRKQVMMSKATLVPKGREYYCGYCNDYKRVGDLMTGDGPKKEREMFEI